MELHNASFVVVDVETTGLSAAHHRMTEIALVQLLPAPAGGWRVAETFQTLLNPEQYIPPFITRHTGITNAMVYGQPKFGEIATTVKDFFSKTSGAVLSGHNVRFDHGFLSHSFHSTGDPFDPGECGLVCTCRLARRLLPQLRSKSLASVQAYFGIRNVRQHRALNDAEATAQVLLRFLEMAGSLEIDTLDAFLRLQYTRPNYARRTTRRQKSLREIVREFPERAGVYTMKGTYGEVLYVGKAKNLKSRVGSYFSESHTQGTKLATLMKTVRDISYEETGSELSALLLESRKIKEYRPRFNAMERWYRPQSFLRLDVQNDFPELTFSREPAEDGAEYFGPFKSREAAEALIEILNRAFKLRECGDKFRVGAEEKPCLYYEIKRCGGPCALLQTKSEYREEVVRLQEFLAAGDDGILAHVEQLMRTAADRLEFETANFYKFRWLELRRVLGSGDREDASISGNDFIVLNPLETDRSGVSSCEVLFVRFGRLVKQVILNQEYLQALPAWTERQLRHYYGATSSIPPTAGKPEIDEMRILMKWVEESRKKGTQLIYIEQNWEASAQKLVQAVRELVQPAKASIPVATLTRERKLRLTPMKKG